MDFSACAEWRRFIRPPEADKPLEDPALSGLNGMFLKFLFHRGEMFIPLNA
jgi:hypothetical protein